MHALRTPNQAARQLTDVRRRVPPAGVNRLRGTELPGLYAWFVDSEGAQHLTQQDANLRRALRIAKPNAVERITLEIDEVAAEMRQAVATRDDVEQARKPLTTSKRFVQQTMDEVTGLIESSALDTRVAWVRDLLDRVTVDGREEHAVAIWRTASDDGVNRSDSVSSWLRR